MVWRINTLRNYGYKIHDDVFFQKTNFLLNINSLNNTSFDFYYLWRVGINIFNIDMTKHNEEFLEDTITKISEARYFQLMVPYRPIGVAVTVSVNNPININENVDVVIVKDIKDKDEFLSFRRKHSKLRKLILVWISSYRLDDIDFIIKVSDGVVLDFFDHINVIQKYCEHLFKKCREMHKPIILFKPILIEIYASKTRELLPIAKKLVDYNLDGVLLEDNRSPSNVKHCIYNLLCGMEYIDLIKERKEHLNNYFKTRAELKLPVLPPLSIAHAATLAAINCGAPLIIVLSRSGRSARWISCARPPCHIMAITTQPATARRLHVYKQVFPLLYDQPSARTWQEEYWNRLQFGTVFALKIGLMCKAAKFVVLSSHGGDGYCNSFQVLTLRELNALSICYE